MKKLAKNKWVLGGLMTGLMMSAVTPSAQADEANTTEDTEKLVIMGTTDIHANMMPYDYMNDTVDDTYGLTKVHTLVDEIRSENEHTVLLDNGDTIQGSIFGDMLALVDPVGADEDHVIMDAMNLMGYDAATLGNHEFNFGLDYMEETIGKADFPWLSANVYDAETDELRYDPYTIIEKDINGETLNVGVIGFVPPQIMTWDRVHLDGNVYVNEIVESAETYVPELKEEGADIVVAVAHSGINPADDASENAAYQLSQVEGIDAMILGHQHNVFPGTDAYADIDGIDAENGTVNGLPTVMPGAWGSHLGVIEFDLRHTGEAWEVAGFASESRETADYEPHPEMVELVQETHEATIEYVNSPVGETSTDLNTYFSRVMDNEVVQLVNDAQLDYMEQNFAGTEYEDMAMLSAAAPFRAGRGGAYTNVTEGNIAIRDVNDIYVYPNTLHVVKVNGTELHNWLERSAENFLQIDPESDERQFVVNTDFASFDFDTIEGVDYQIDVTQPVGERIFGLTYEGEDVTEEDEFLVATNNYRAGGGGAHIEGVETVLASTDENREVIIDYIRDHDGPLEVEVTNNWSLVPFETNAEVVFESDMAGETLADATSFVSFVESVNDTTGLFQIHPSAQEDDSDEEEEDDRPGNRPPHAGQPGPPPHAGQPGPPPHAKN
ncbi:bifunctional 2',3'-cyclic-nucleotide 2'-phosphodiesterase/3'-nucleotidase [Alteribacter aurantiacus]|uniref:bifunctional 2',3'-cyclic-nucleotide 2'-phosphodiesterase/3'-nucleotidase n=1 Tax=Alteribacter aurantiacus TaxID=254410 RepID=UPI0003FD00FD|nr:bifunctional 2',3'-cyclic-nucleotide 2'-phosphodiesterase/3'-nucleotidase [Alteribacter aurantiacus]